MMQIKTQSMNNQKGFTMIELLLYMGMFSILIVVLMQIFTSILSAHAESQANSLVDQEGSYMLARLTYDIRRASTIVPPTPLGTPRPTLHITGSGSFDETFSVDGSGNLILTDSTAGTSIPINNVDTSVAVSFTPIGNSAVTNSKTSIKIVLTVTSRIKKQAGITEAQTYETTVQTR